MADRPVNNHKGIAKFLTYKGRISRKQFMIYHLYAFVVCITLLNLFLLAFPAWKLEVLKGAVGLFCLISLFFGQDGRTIWAGMPVSSPCWPQPIWWYMYWKVRGF